MTVTPWVAAIEEWSRSRDALWDIFTEFLTDIGIGVNQNGHSSMHRGSDAYEFFLSTHAYSLGIMFKDHDAKERPGYVYMNFGDQGDEYADTLYAVWSSEEVNYAKMVKWAKNCIAEVTNE